MAQTIADLISKVADLLRGRISPTSTASFTLRRRSASRWLHGVEDFDDAVDVCLREHRFRTCGCVIGVRRFKEPRRFHDAVGSEFVDDQVDEPDLLGGESGAVKVGPERFLTSGCRRTRRSAICPALQRGSVAGARWSGSDPLIFGELTCPRDTARFD